MTKRKAALKGFEKTQKKLDKLLAQLDGLDFVGRFWGLQADADRIVEINPAPDKAMRNLKDEAQRLKALCKAHHALSLNCLKATRKLVSAVKRVVKEDSKL